MEPNVPSSASCLWYTRCASSSCSLVTYFVICLFDSEAYSIAQAGLELILRLNDESFAPLVTALYLFLK